LEPIFWKWEINGVAQSDAVNGHLGFICHLRFGIWDLGFGIWDLFVIVYTGYRRLEFGIYLSFGTWNLELGTWNLELGVYF
jgi:hypothetical protein